VENTLLVLINGKDHTSVEPTMIRLNQGGFFFFFFQFCHVVVSSPSDNRPQEEERAKFN